MQQRRDNLDHRLDCARIARKKDGKRKRAQDQRQAELDKAWQKHLAELERISGLSRDEAKALLLTQVEKKRALTWRASSARPSQSE
jgi:ribonuclease Y